MKTQQEIQDLKDSWLNDPIWDIYETEGFEDHYDELKKFQEEYVLDNKTIRIKRLEERAIRLGIPGNIKLVEYLEALEWKIDCLGFKN